MIEMTTDCLMAHAHLLSNLANADTLVVQAHHFFIPL